MTTSVVTLEDNAWTDLGAGACYFSLAKETDKASVFPIDDDKFQDTVLVHIGTSDPGINSFAYHEVTKDFNYTGTDHVWARSLSGTRVIKYSAVA